MEFLITIVSFFLVLGVLVFFHELGHYWVARRSGIVVEEFGMGYPPRAAKLFTYDGTDFTLNWLPFGGFARMKGEDASDMSPGSFNAASRTGRALTLLAGPAMNFLLAIVLFAASFMVGGAEMVMAHPQAVDTAATANATIGVQPNDVLLEANGLPVEVNALLEESPRTTLAPGADALTLTVLRDGARVELPGVSGEALTAWLNNAANYVPTMTTRIEATAPDSPAEEAGLQSGDLVYAAGGQVITPEVQLGDIVGNYLGSPMTLDLLRDGELVSATMTPRANPPEGQGALGVQIGIVSEFADMPFGKAIVQGFKSTWQYVTLVLELPVRLLQGTIDPAAAQVSGPVGIAREVGGAMTSSIDYGVFWPILRLSAVISAALAITNLLPLPALDGGRLLFIAIEAIRGRRVSPQREGMVHMVGFMLLLSLMVFITVRDIAAPAQTIDWSLILGN